MMQIVAILLAFAYLLGPTAFFTQQHAVPISNWTSMRDRERIVTIASDGTLLRGFVYRVPGARPWMLRFYGADGGAYASDTFDRWLSKQYAVNLVVVDYRGYGFTAGSPTFALAQDDALRIFDHVRRLAGNRSIILFGGSLGTSMASYVTRHRVVAGLILQGAMSDVKSMVTFWQVEHLGPLGYLVDADADGASGMANAARLREMKVPLLILHGDQDRNISVDDARRNFDASASSDKTLIIVKGSPHLVNLSGTPAGRLFGDFVARVSNSAAAGRSQAVGRSLVVGM